MVLSWDVVFALSAAAKTEVDPLLLALLPVGSAMLGSVLTLIGQALGDRRIHRRERLARRDQLQIQIYQEDRENLHALQQSLVDVSELYFGAVAEETGQLSEGSDAKIARLLKSDQILRSNELVAQQIMWFHRCRSEAVREALEAYHKAIFSLHESGTVADLQAGWEKHLKAFGNAQEAIGAELRRSPLDMKNV